MYMYIYIYIMGNYLPARLNYETIRDKDPDQNPMMADYLATVITDQDIDIQDKEKILKDLLNLF